jgi:2-keto-4-pentenoate hydratase
VSAQQPAGAGTRVGNKVGLTSHTMQSMCDIDSRVSVVVLSSRVFPSPARLTGADFGRPGHEFEIAVRMGRDLLRTGQCKPLSLEEVAESVGGVCVPLDIMAARPHRSAAHVEKL